ncbi:hypothetical protein ACOMHN_060996 [Nucella lapillus]
MGKNKKHRQKKNKENEAEESSDDAIPTCSHIAKAVNFAAMRKALVRQACKIGECTSCNLGASKGQKKGKGENNASSPSQDSDQDLQTTIWVCLQCGHQGCDRHSQEKHALKHYEMPHSGIHCLVINLTTWATWCYACDDDVLVENKRIQECMDFLRKQLKVSPLGRSQPANENSNQSLSQQCNLTNNQTGSPLPNSTAISDQPAQNASGKSSDIMCQRVKGLNNLGNTCFFNAVMQSMCQTPGFEALLGERCHRGATLSVAGWNDTQKDSDIGSESENEEDSRIEELSPIKIEMGEPGPLSLSLTNFVQEMNVSGGKNTVSPNGLFSNICKQAQRFRGYQQQDSHELLRYLVDVVRNEELKRAQGGILRHFKLPEQATCKGLDVDIKRQIKGYGRPVKFTFVDSLFGGQLVSTITCEECSHVSQIVESFLDLSLPVTEEKPQRPNQILGGRHKESTAATSAAANGKEAMEDDDRPAMKGVDGFAERSGKPSKYQERKNRKQAKKEAKKKGRVQNVKNQVGLNKSCVKDYEEEDDEAEGTEGKGEEKEEEGGGDSGTTGDPTDPTQHAPGEEETERRVKEEPSDADVEDNADSEATSLQMVAGVMQSNLTSTPPTTTTTPHHHLTLSSNSNLDTQSNLPEHQGPSDGEGSLVNLDIKSGTQKETHILPKAYAQSGDSCQVSSSGGEAATGIKEGRQCGVEKLSSDISSLTLNDSGLGRTEGASDELSAVDQGRREDTGTEISSPEICRSGGIKDERPRPSPPLSNGEVDSGRTEKEGGLKPSLATESGLGKSPKSPNTVSDSTATMHGSFNDANAFSPTRQGAGDKPRTDVYKEARHKSKTTLAPRYQSSSKECSVMSCLNQFTSAELLTGPNKVKCKACTRASPAAASPDKDKKKPQAVYSNASKQYLILAPPAVLTLHLKRFEQVGFGCRKVNRHVVFPTLLDLAPYCSALCQEVRRGQGRVLYSLYGLVEHSGRLHGGHYTAYVKVRPGLSPVNRFLRTQPLKSHDFIHRLIEQLSSGAADEEENGEEDDDDDTSSSTATQPTPGPEGRWFHVSDSSVNAVPESKVLSAQAYLLFYERIY